MEEPEPTAFDRVVGARIKERREALGLSQADLAHALRMKEHDVRTIEDGCRIAGTNQLITLASALKVKAVYLLGG